MEELNNYAEKVENTQANALEYVSGEEKNEYYANRSRETPFAMELRADRLRPSVRESTAKR